MSSLAAYKNKRSCSGAYFESSAFCVDANGRNRYAPENKRQLESSTSRPLKGDSEFNYSQRFIFRRVLRIPRDLKVHF